MGRKMREASTETSSYWMRKDLPFVADGRLTDVFFAAGTGQSSSHVTMQTALPPEGNHPVRNELNTDARAGNG